MATGGEVPGWLPDSAGSEYPSQQICKPCLEKDNLIDATGLCVDCQDYLCLKCFHDHKRRHHRVLDREQHLHAETQTKPEDSCSDSCPVHENEVIQYYCANHCHLGCKSCINLDHATCDEVHFIPHVAKKHVNNENYRQVENQLKLALDTFTNVFRNARRNSDEVDKSCEYALRELQAFKRQIDESLNNIERELIEMVQTLRLKAEKELAELRNKYKTAHDELQSSLAKIEALQNAYQHSSSYIEMMRTKAKLKALEDQTQQAGVDISYRQSPIQFYPNQELLELLRIGTVASAGTLDLLSGSDEVPVLPDTDTGSVQSWSDDLSVISDTESRISHPSLRIASIIHGSDTGGNNSGSAFGTQNYHLQELNVKTELDKCLITGMAVLPDSRLVLIDNRHNSVKVVDLRTGQVVIKETLRSRPWDVAFIEKNEVAYTIPNLKSVAFKTFDDNNPTAHETIAVNGRCFGVDYKNGKLAVSFINPDKVQILNMKGRVLHNIKDSKSEEALFNHPRYLTSNEYLFNFPTYITFGQDDTTLYVSNFFGNNVLCVKVDGPIVATHSDKDLKNPRKAVVDSRGNVYVCMQGSNAVLQFTKDCKKLQVVLTQTDGLLKPLSICLSEEEDKLYVGMDSDYVKVYRTDRN